MIIQCDGCKTRFRIADEKVTGRGVRVRCTRCGQTFVVRKGADGKATVSSGAPPAAASPPASAAPAPSAPAKKDVDLDLDAKPPAPPIASDGSGGPGADLFGGIDLDADDGPSPPPSLGSPTDTDLDSALSALDGAFGDVAAEDVGLSSGASVAPAPSASAPDSAPATDGGGADAGFGDDFDDVLTAAFGETPAAPSSAAAAPPADPFGGGDDAAAPDPFGGGDGAAAPDPFAGGDAAPAADPFGGGDAGGVDPFGSGAADPFGGGADPGGGWASGGSLELDAAPADAAGPDPFAGGEAEGDDPFSSLELAGAADGAAGPDGFDLGGPPGFSPGGAEGGPDLAGDDPFASLDVAPMMGDDMPGLDGPVPGGLPREPTPPPRPEPAGIAVARIRTRQESDEPTVESPAEAADEDGAHRRSWGLVIANGVFTLGLLVVAFAAFVAYRTEGPISGVFSAARIHRAFTGAAAGEGLEVTRLSNGLYRTSGGRRILVITGSVKNQGKQPIPDGKVEVSAVDGGGAVLATAKGVVGARPDAADVYALDGQASVDALMTKLESSAPAQVAPGKTLPFIAILPAWTGDITRARFVVKLGGKK